MRGEYYISKAAVTMLSKLLAFALFPVFSPRAP